MIKSEDYQEIIKSFVLDNKWQANLLSDGEFFIRCVEGNFANKKSLLSYIEYDKNILNKEDLERIMEYFDYFEKKYPKSK